jgi:DNA polymerase I-like protein with 3'-5' exonuclease and polymerase domains
MEYDLGKRTVHGSNYGMNAYRFVEVAKKYGGLTLTEKYAEWLLGRYHSIFLNIKGRYHKKIQDALKTTRTLTTCWGRKRVFSGIPNEDMFKEGYAYVAQSAIADWLNLLMCRCYWRMKVEGLDVLWLAQIHDAFLISPTHKDVERCKQIIKEESERPFMCGGEALVVPAEVKVGDNWYEMN